MTGDSRAKKLIEVGDRLYSAKGPLDTLWQEQAEHFYPERADFITSRSLGTEFASHLMTGSPVMARRDLANQINAMLRPSGKSWFMPSPYDEELAEHPAVIEVMGDYAKRMRRAMYEPLAMFTRATKEGDHDFATFGQCALTVEFSVEHNRLLYRSWHLRDLAWSENDNGVIDCIHRKQMMSARNIMARYKGKTPFNIAQCCTTKNDPHKEFELRHIVVPYDEYDYGDKPKHREGKFNFMMVVIAKDDMAVLFEQPLVDHPYIIPRWATMSMSQYGYSPATMIALPDARLLQRMTFTLLEAGEKATNPPMIAITEAIRSDIALYAGGITAVDADYDEKTGEVLRPLNMDHSGLKFGMEMGEKHIELIKAAFYLNQIKLPDMGNDPTATEIRVRTQEYIRAATPLFEPMEAEYNGQLLEKTFNLMQRNGGFGSRDRLPPMLSRQEIRWTFDSPISDSVKKEDVVSFKESAELLAIAAQIDPALVKEYDARKAFRKAMTSLKAPLISEEEADAMREQAQQMQELQAGMAMAGHAGGVAEQVGKAAQSFQALAPPEQQGAPA